MNAGQLQSLKELIEFLKQQGVGGFELEQEGLKVRLRFAGQDDLAERAIASQIAHPANQTQNPAPAPAALHPSPTQSSETATAATAASGETGLHIIKSPIVGTFYEASAPGAEPFVKIGDKVEAGQVVCIVEAMKLMNEIECDASGEIVERMVASGQPVEYGQALFAVRPR